MKSLADLVEEFGLVVYPLSVESVREELRRQFNALHPDRSGGKFPSLEVEERYHRLRETLASLDGQLLPVPVSLDGLTQQLQATNKRLELALASQAIAPAAKQSSEEIRRDARARYAPRKLGSAVFAAICAGVLTLSNLWKDNPLLGFVGGRPYVVAGLGFLLVISGGAFAFLWFKEVRAARRVDWLMSDYGISTLLRTVVGFRTRDDAEHEILVSKTALVRAIQDLGRPWAKSSVRRWWKRLAQPQIPTILAEAIVRQHLDELLRRQIIQPKGRRGIESVFVIDPDVVRDLENGSYYLEWS